MAYSNKIQRDLFADDTKEEAPKEYRKPTKVELRKAIETEQKNKKARETFEDIYVRKTFLLNRELAARLNKVKSNAEHGWLTVTFNKVVEELLKQYE